MMPLYHVGGLVRNIFAPIFSGGSTVCCSAFDPSLFWDVVEEIPVTWYYASPSMHSVILAVASERQAALQQNRIRLACNAAGGLLPSLACRLRDTFECTVLPSYGMTECMPISTPPLDYQLDREGTSGVSTGPGISVLDWSDSPVPVCDVGRICVRGEPVFPGYLKPDGTLDRTPFNSNGWFDTGDLGYMDKDGYLYITGRSKEVINRGGELISPFEVENAIMRSSMSLESPLYGRIAQALAFSVPHDILQEVVAVVLVTPNGMPRVDLKTLQTALRSSLQQVKWPVLITYMDDLPKKNNKVLRIKLGQRCGIPELTDDTPYLSRHWQGTCPPPDTDLSVPIISSLCTIDYSSLSVALDNTTSVDFRNYCRQNHLRGTLEAFISPVESSSGALNQQPDVLKALLSKTLHGYMIPEHIHLLSDPLPLDHSGIVDNGALDRLLADLGNAPMQELEASTEGKVRKVFADILCRPPLDIALDVDFFTLGGDSLKAGRLVSTLRSTFNTQIPINLVFNQGTVSAIAAFIEKMAEFIPVEATPGQKIGCSKTYSSTNPIVMFLQLIPLAVIYPLRRAVQWTAFIVAMSFVQRWPTNQHTLGRLFNVVLSVMFSKFVIRCVSPLFGIAAKWLIIGRYREGLYPMWGAYHTRWWMVQKIVSICGKGFFNINDSTKRLYFRLMGAKIGRNVKIAGTALGEWDLLDIRDGATLTRCTCRPFAVEGNTSMYLGRIVIGENASIGLSSIVAPGAVVPPNTCIGPNSSSWELEDADEENRNLSPSQAPKPHILLTCFITIPLVFLSWVLSLLPWLGGLVGMVMDMPVPDASPMRDILDWFSEAKRVGFHSLALVLRSLLSPFIFFAFAVLVKIFLDAVLGKMTSDVSRNRGAINMWRAVLMKTLLPVSRLHDMTAMFGQHYEATSNSIRLLGGRVGKRVYWPGTGPGIGDYHLLDIGNDVVFGSRSHLITSDGTGSETITIRDRAMIADRVCILPGVTVGEHTTMGSGALTRRGKSYISGGTFVGSKGRDCVHLSGGNSSGQDEKNETRQRIRHMSSDDTLTGAKADSKKSSVRIRIHHSSSDDTLAESRLSKTKRGTKRYGHTKEIFTASGSDTDDNQSETMEADHMSPFGRAFYLKLAPYHVLGPFAIFCYSSFITVFTSFYWNAPIVTCVQLVNYLMNRYVARESGTTFNVVILFLLSWAGISILFTTMAVLALLVVIASKWVLLGRRMPGNYDWDKSSYCQRWQLFLSIERLRRHCYHSQGVLGLLTGTSWIVLYFRALGANIGKDCALFANGRPSLMFTEPDLITLGDRVAIDDASVVAHINTQGKFDLNRLSIGDSCLLEHTLIMGGDVVEENWTMQGWPAERYTGKRAAIE
ncbi:peroxisomal-coenzyme a synthetase [Trichoderma arundinaceum]|uniref:Peroxisomal-coenzyme a synthetase n=1 Tax=Trichoderma arundinaceum TaxID=490622 RepID=A0A395NDX6_TRIAR|nr:peroxisomal-coenzyme a synthetase [Trichoderma arundinaceum]